MRTETRELADYLAKTDVGGYAPLLRSGVLVAQAIEIAGRDTLGRTWSIFGNLGGLEAPRTVGRAKYVVGEVREILARRDCSDARSRDRLAALIEAERAGRLADRRMTIALTGVGPIVIDGNKRAAAIYELASAEIVLPAFLVEPAPGRPALPMP